MWYIILLVLLIAGLLLTQKLFLPALDIALDKKVSNPFTRSPNLSFLVFWILYGVASPIFLVMLFTVPGALNAARAETLRLVLEEKF